MPAGDVLRLELCLSSEVCNIETIRYYERAGLLPKPERRQEAIASIDRGLFRLALARSRRYGDLGFSLDEVRRLLDLADQKLRSCRRVHDIAVDDPPRSAQKIAGLRRMERVLAIMGEGVRSRDDACLPTP